MLLIVEQAPTLPLFLTRVGALVADLVLNIFILSCLRSSKSPPLCWYLADGERVCVSQGLWKLYQRGLRPQAELAMPARSQRPDEIQVGGWAWG